MEAFIIKFILFCFCACVVMYIIGFILELIHIILMFFAIFVSFVYGIIERIVKFKNKVSDFIDDHYLVKKRDEEDDKEMRY